MENIMKLPKCDVIFDKETHEYHRQGMKLSGVTPIISWLFPETYAGIPQSVMTAAAEYGSMIHSACQMSDVVGIAEHESVRAYQSLKKRMGLKTIANEYLVSDEVSIASSIDVVCEQDGIDGDALVDIKTTSRVHHHHLAVQLSIYAWLYEWQTGRKVGNLYCIWLPKERYGQPDIIPVQRVASEVCQFIVKEYFTAGNTNEKARQALVDAGLDITESVPQVAAEQIPAQYGDVVDEVIRIETELASLKEREKTLKDGLLQLMRENGVKKWTADGLTLTYIAETKRKAVDTKKLQAEYPDVYDKCICESKVSDTIKITVS